jgi:hypothetical protein
LIIDIGIGDYIESPWAVYIVLGDLRGKKPNKDRLRLQFKLPNLA